jgi:hypothetical protein
MERNNVFTVTMTEEEAEARAAAAINVAGIDFRIIPDKGVCGGNGSVTGRTIVKDWSALVKYNKFLNAWKKSSEA